MPSATTTPSGTPITPIGIWRIVNATLNAVIDPAASPIRLAWLAAAADAIENYCLAQMLLTPAKSLEEALALAYQRLGELVDAFGHRLSGSVALEQAHDWILDEMRADGLDDNRRIMSRHGVRSVEAPVRERIEAVVGSLVKHQAKGT